MCYLLYSTYVHMNTFNKMGGGADGWGRRRRKEEEGEVKEGGKKGAKGGVCVFV